MFEVYFWVNATVEKDLRVIRSNVRFKIDELFEQNDIVISFPQRDVHLDGSITIQNASGELQNIKSENNASGLNELSADK
jgi:small-conductance mechanosensitive channel